MAAKNNFRNNTQKIKNKIYFLTDSELQKKKRIFTLRINIHL